jgi:hypothetical protein
VGLVCGVALLVLAGVIIRVALKAADEDAPAPGLVQAEPPKVTEKEPEQPNLPVPVVKAPPIVSEDSAAAQPKLPEAAKANSEDELPPPRPEVATVTPLPPPPQAAPAPPENKAAPPPKTEPKPPDPDRVAHSPAQYQDAIDKGLHWLAMHQAPDGHWGLHDFNLSARDEAGRRITCNCDCDSERQNDIVGTALSLLPFLAAGITHKPGAKGDGSDYSATVKAGIGYLTHEQYKNGYFGGDMNGHALAAFALCETYGMTQDDALKSSAQRAVDFICNAQDPQGGGWCNIPRKPGDLYVTGLQMTALRSARLAGLSVREDTLEKVKAFLDTVESKDKGYAKLPGEDPTYAMTAVGILCRYYLGANLRSPDLRTTLEHLKAGSPGDSGVQVLAEFYAGSLMHLLGGEYGDWWVGGHDGKGGARAAVVAAQQHNSGDKQHIEGSWPGYLTPEGGRLMATSLALLCLEIPDGHLLVFHSETSRPPAPGSGRPGKPSLDKRSQDEKYAQAARKVTMAGRMLKEALEAESRGLQEDVNRAQRMRQEARFDLQEVVKDYPKTEAAEKARELLKKLEESDKARPQR